MLLLLCCLDEGGYAVPADDVYRSGGSDDGSALGTHPTAAVALAGAGSNGGSAVACLAPADGGEGFQIVAGHGNLLDVILDDPLYEAVRGFRVAPSVLL